MTNIDTRPGGLARRPGGSPVGQPIRRVWLALLVGLQLAGCGSPSRNDQTATSSDQSDRFADKVTLRYARAFTIAYFPNYKVVSMINPFGESSDTLRYALVQRGTPHPAGFPAGQIIEIPIRNLVATSSMHVGLLGFLGVEDRLVGMSNLTYISSPVVLQRAKAGKVVDVGQDQPLNEEQLITMHPDLLMTMGSPDARLDRYRTLIDAGIPVLINSEWGENTPLGRAEWVKLMAALFNQEKEVNARFAKVEAEYSRLAALARKAPEKPTLISGLNTKDAWYVPNGDSYMARFFGDAGGSYPWANSKAPGTLPLNFEAVYPVALKADYWLNVGFGTGESRQDILAKDARYADFKAFKTGRMYNYGKRVNAQGANDFYESGVVSPQLVLADLIKILHPSLLPNHQLVYYEQLR